MIPNKESNTLSRKEFYWYLIACCGVVVLASIAIIVSLTSAPRATLQRQAYTTSAKVATPPPYRETVIKQDTPTLYNATTKPPEYTLQPAAPTEKPMAVGGVAHATQSPTQTLRVSGESVPNISDYLSGVGLDAIISNISNSAELVPTDAVIYTSAPTQPPVVATATVVVITVMPEPTATPEPPVDDGVMRINASVASTYLSNPNGSTLYTPEQMTDGYEETCWQFRTSDIGKLSDAYVDFTFSGAGSISQLWIKNGFWKITKGLDQYTRNSRPKKIEVSFLYKGQSDYSDNIQITLKDDKKRKDWQVVKLGEHENVQAVRIRVMSIYKGTKFPKDVAISEVEFH